MTWPNILTLITVPLNGVVTALIAWLVSRKMNRELEDQKAFLSRSSRVHERSVDALVKLYSQLSEAENNLRLLLMSNRPEGEMSDQQLVQVFVANLTNAQRELRAGRLLVPNHIGEDCDAFFQAVQVALLNFSLSKDSSTTDYSERSSLVRKAQEIASLKIPELLDKIRRAAREEIHSANQPTR